MGRYIGPACKRCRRLGVKLFLKGDRCYMAKCPIEQGHSVPGQHGGRRPRLKDYGLQLQEKQRLRNMYGATCTACRKANSGCSSSARCVPAASPAKSSCRRSKCAWTTSSTASALRPPAAPRGSVNIPSYKGKPGDVIQAREAKRSRDYAKTHLDAAESRGWPVWLNVDKAEHKAEILHVPTREEIAPIVNEQLIVELYSK